MLVRLRLGCFLLNARHGLSMLLSAWLTVVGDSFFRLLLRELSRIPFSLFETSSLFHDVAIRVNKYKLLNPFWQQSTRGPSTQGRELSNLRLLTIDTTRTFLEHLQILLLNASSRL